MNKPVILFTNFWDANKLLTRKHFMFWNDGKLFKVQLNPKRYRVYSIALSHPPLAKLPNISKEPFDLERLDLFCPTYDMLKDRKNGGSWSEYVDKFHGLIKKRREDIVSWVKSLMPNQVYILCCWENTSGKANCHRQLLYEAMSKSKTLKNRAVYTYRDGSWDDAYGSNNFYSYVDSLLANHNAQQIPVMVGSQTLADELGVPVNSQIGTGTYGSAGSWSMHVDGSVQDSLSDMLEGLTTVSGSSSIQMQPNDPEDTPF
jgi:hypothetical protein